LKNEIQYIYNFGFHFSIESRSINQLVPIALKYLVERIELAAHSFAFYGFAFFGIILARYFILAGGTHIFLEHIFNQSQFTSNTYDAEAHQDRSPLSWQLIRKDIKLSILSSIVFALGAASVISAYDLGQTRLYADIHQYPLWYLGFSYVVTIVLQDTYFYFLHRLFHHPWLFRWCHQGHHLSKHPTPWTSFAFDPLEAFAQGLFLVGIVFLIPLHFITMIAVLSTMTAWGIINHLGLEQLPNSFPHHWCGKWFTGPAHHALHHHRYTLHYGLYFTFWDRQLGTQSPHYDQELAHVTH
jgi:Delta7-sterol 5-desaturase